MPPPAPPTVRIRLLRPLRDEVGAGEVTLAPRDPHLLAALAELAEAHPGLAAHLFEGAEPARGAARPLGVHVNVYRNGQVVPGDEAASVVLQDGDELLLLLAVSGGAAHRQVGPGRGKG